MAKIATMAIIVLLAAASSSLPAVLANASFVAITCKSSDNPQCVAVLACWAQTPRSANATTVRELASIALDIANAEASSAYLSGEADRRYRTDIGDALSDCFGYYGGAANALDTARNDFDGGGVYDGAEKEAGDAEAAADRCEQAFTDRRLKSTVSDVDKRMKDRTSVASDLIDLLWGFKHRRSGRRLLRA